MKVLITGTTGFMGRNIVKHLLKRDASIYATTRSKENIFDEDRITWLTQDLSQELHPNSLPEVDIIIHLAQSKNYKQFPDMALDIFKVNCLSVMNLLDYGRKVGIRNFIYASSGAVYDPKEDAYREDDCLAPPNFYATSKYISEKLILSYSNYFSTNILRYFFPYGKGQQNMMIPNLINSVMDGRPVYLSNDTGMKFTPVYIDDAVEATIRAASLETSNIFNIAGTEVTSIRQMAEAIGSIVNRKPVFELKAQTTTTNYIANTDKMKDLLNIKKTTPIREGLLKTING